MYMINYPLIYRTIEKNYPDGKLWVVFVESDNYVKVALYGSTKGSEKMISRTYTFKEHRYLIYQVPAVLKRAGWLSTALSTLDSIAEKYD